MVTVKFSRRFLTLAACLSISYGIEASESTPNSGMLDEVIVTATKRAERAQDVPSSISVLSSVQLEDLHATNLEDIASYAPGLVISGGGSPGQTSIILRGLNSQQNGSLVATVLDDVPVGSSAGWVREDAYQLDLLPYDIERIEVLRGPQGTLYGADSMGGVLKYVTKSPDLNDLHAQAGAEGFGIQDASNAGYAGRFMVNAPLIDGQLAARFSAYDRHTPGYIDNPLRGARGENALEQRGGHLSVLFQPNDRLSMKLQVLYQKIDSSGNANVKSERLGSVAPYRVGPPLEGDLVRNHPLPEAFVADVKFFSYNLDWNLGFADLTSVSSYSDKKLDQIQDFSDRYGYLLPILDPHVPPTTSTLVPFVFQGGTQRYTEELRLASPSGRRFEWLVGGFYTHETGHNYQILNALNSDQSILDRLNPLVFVAFPTTYQEEAAFANLTYRFTDMFDMTGGIRRSKNSQVVDQHYSGALYGGASSVSLPAGEYVNTYAFSPRLHLTRDAMLYLRLATGYRPGGPNVIIPLYPQIPPQTTADRTTNYEVGFKGTFFERRVSLDLAVFKVRWSDLQSSTCTPDGNACYSINAGQAVTQGAEFSAEVALTEALRLVLNGAYTDAHVSQTVPAVGAVDGTRLPTAPRWTGASTINYQLPNVQRWTPRLSAGLRIISDQYTELSNSSTAGILPGYTLADFNATLSDGRYEFALYAKNLADRRVFSSAFTRTDQRSGDSYFYGSVVQPRTIGLSVDAKF